MHSISLGSCFITKMRYKMSRYKTTNLIIDKRKRVTRYVTTIYDDVPKRKELM